MVTPGFSQDRGPGRQSQPLQVQPAVDEPSAEHLQLFRHDLGNLLYSIWLQVRCAEISIDSGNIDTARDSLHQIEVAIQKSRDLMEDLR